MPSFPEIFQSLAPVVWRFLRRLGVAESELEDLCQEVFLLVHDRLPTFDGDSSLKTWVLGIALRVAANHRRLARVRREVPTADLPDEAFEAPQEALIDQRSAIEQLQRVLTDLDEDKRAVFVLHDIEEVPMAQIAPLVGCPLQTAYARLYAARRLLQAS
ncbi:MAG: RNA polymerase sigma factor, partial [Myxococcales bacterium]